MNTFSGKFLAGLLGVALGLTGSISTAKGAPLSTPAASAESVFGRSTFSAGQEQREPFAGSDWFTSPIDVYASLAQVFTQDALTERNASGESFADGTSSRHSGQRVEASSSSSAAEPSGWVMLLAALGAIGFVTYRRSRG